MTEIVMGAVAGRRAVEGEVIVWSLDPDSPGCAAVALDDPGLALRVLETGLDGFPHQGDSIRRILVSDDPALDDALAASLLRRLAGDDDLPDFAPALAEYSRSARLGLTPLGLSTERSVLAFYTSMRRLAGKDLSLPDNRNRFLDGWSRLECALVTASSNGIDPLGSGFLADHPSFIRERAYLARDHENYAHDVKQGERWNIRFPGREHSAAGLFLTSPSSFLFRSWSLSDPDAPGGEGYLFMAVEQGLGKWVLSVDPREDHSLEPLWKILQQMEVDRVGERADQAPWTLMGSPGGHQISAPHGGSALPPAEILHVIKGWLTAAVARKTSMTARLKNTLKFNRRSI